MESYHTIFPVTELPPEGIEICKPRCEVCSKRGCVTSNHSQTEQEVAVMCRTKINNLSSTERAAWDKHWNEMFENPNSADLRIDEVPDVPIDLL